MIEQKRLMQIIDRFVDSRLTELTLESEDFKLVLKSQNEVFVDSASAMRINAPSPEDVQAPMGGAAGNESDSSSNQNANQSDNPSLETIISPIVGTFYRSPAPDAPPFLDLGTEVKAGDSLCIIEAMKIMNKLEADFDCKIVTILVESGAMIEYGTPLFEVKRL